MRRMISRLDSASIWVTAFQEDGHLVQVERHDSDMDARVRKFERGLDCVIRFIPENLLPEQVKPSADILKPARFKPEKPSLSDEQVRELIRTGKMQETDMIFTTYRVSKTGAMTGGRPQSSKPELAHYHVSLAAAMASAKQRTEESKAKDGNKAWQFHYRAQPRDARKLNKGGKIPGQGSKKRPPEVLVVHRWALHVNHEFFRAFNHFLEDYPRETGKVWGRTANREAIIILFNLGMTNPTFVQPTPDKPKDAKKVFEFAVRLNESDNKTLLDMMPNEVSRQALINRILWSGLVLWYEALGQAPNVAE